MVLGPAAFVRLDAGGGLRCDLSIDVIGRSAIYPARSVRILQVSTMDE